MLHAFALRVLIGYVASVLIELLVLWPGLAPEHSRRVRIFAAIWLTACTYPIVAVVLPILMRFQPHWLYLLVAETFAPVAECLLFGLAFGKDKRLMRKLTRDDLVICVANLTSFGLGELWWRW